MSYENNIEELKCPYCECRVDRESLEYGDGEISEIECECGKKFTVTTQISYDFTIQCGDEDTDDCDWAPFDYGKGLQYHEFGGKNCVYCECKRCGETNYVPLEKLDGDAKNNT